MRTLLRPTAFVDSPFGHDGKVAQLAGGLSWFAGVELIRIEVLLGIENLADADVAVHRLADHRERLGHHVRRPQLLRRQPRAQLKRARPELLVCQLRRRAHGKDQRSARQFIDSECHARVPFSEKRFAPGSQRGSSLQDPDHSRNHLRYFGGRECSSRVQNDR